MLGRRRLAAAMVAGVLPLTGTVAGQAADAAPQPTAEGKSVTVQLDPSYQQPAFEGWGTSLVWFANITGGYPDEIRDKLVDMLFGEDGLRLNIARYNIGGGNAPDVPEYLRLGGTMPGFWKAPPGTTREDKDWWDPDNPEHWNFDADANQRWWIDQIKGKVDRWEAFSNSPPWFQTVSGYVSGGFDSSADQIRTDTIDDFATYLVRVTEHLEQAHGIAFDTIDPLNEPNTPYWGTQLGPDGQPTGGRQEGAHAGPALQDAAIQALRRRLASAATDAVVSAPDETNPGTFVTDWNGYTDAARDAIDQLNVHTYGTGQRTSARDVAKGADKKLWMSEVEGSWGSGTSFTSMEPGLGIATRIVDDLRELEPKAWVFWQPIEDGIGQAESGGNWGSIHIPFNCPPDATLETCPIQANTKFHTIRNFTHYIRPGDRIVKVNDTSSVAALTKSGRGATVVHVNNDSAPRTVTLDLSLFAHVGTRATVTPIVSSAAGGLVRGAPKPVADRAATFEVPAKSVTTFLVEDVHGIARNAALVQPGHAYRLQGVQSGRSLAPLTTGAVIRTTDAASAAQLWTVRKLTGGNTNRERYEVATAVDGKRLAVRSGALVLEAAGAADPAAQWVMSSTGDGTWTFVNVATGRLFEVSGQATADGSPVGTWTPTSGPNQRWTVVDETVLRTETAKTYTLPGRRPTLPATVVPVYRDGARGTLPVRWTMPPPARWDSPGVVRVSGVATDPLGRRVDAAADVTVDTFAATEPGRAKAYVGGVPELPATVTGLGDHGGRADLPVTWGTPPPMDQVGVVPVAGVARLVDGSTLPATVRVQVTEPSERNASLDEGAVASATYTEPGYSAAGIRNGDRGDKAWSNWKPNDRNPSDTLTVTLPSARDLTRVVTYFYRDGSNVSFPQSVRLQVLSGGAWVDVGGEVPVGTEGDVIADLPVPASIGLATGARVVMTMRPNGYTTVAEIELLAKAPGVSREGRAASIEVDGVPIPGFDPDVFTYRVPGSVVTATAMDPYAEVAVSGGTVRVTSEDGSQTRTYVVTLE